MRHLIIFSILILFTASCNTKPLYTSSEPTFIGYYDTLSVISDKFLQGTTIIVHLLDDTHVVIWGKYCEFSRGDELFVLSERWYGSGHTICKYYLMNETHKYAIK